MANDDLTIVRRFSARIDATDGRNICGRCLPYDEPALVAEPDGTPYREVFRPGSCKAVARTAGRVMLVYEHRTDLGNTIGPAVSFTETETGLEAVFRAMPGPLGDLALELIRSESVTGLSVQAIVSTRHSRTLEDGTVERSLVKYLEHVALTGTNAYAGAGITAVRSGPDAPDPLRIAEIRAWSDQARLRYARTQ